MAISSSKQLVEINEIRDTVVILNDGSMRSIIEVNSINFDLKSPDEQNAIIQAFQNVINFVDFSLQITLQSKKLDILPYLQSLEKIQAEAPNELLRVQVYEYSRFVKGLAELGNIMSKKFYITIPYYGAAGSGEGAFGPLKKAFGGLFGGNKADQSLVSDLDFQKAKLQLDQRVGVVIGLVSSMGLQGKLLNITDLEPMYFNYFNPGKNI